MNKTTALVVGFGFGAVSYMIARERVWNSAESASRALSDSQKKIVGSKSIPEVKRPDLIPAEYHEQGRQAWDDFKKRISEGWMKGLVEMRSFVINNMFEEEKKK